MTTPTDIGPNRTGIAISPVQSREAIESAREGVPIASLEVRAHHDAAVAWARASDPRGTLPPPASVKGVAKSTFQVLKGRHPNVFLNLLGERLAFERSGVRLYESLLVRFDAATPHEGGPSRADIERFLDDELAHFHLCVKAMQKLGADPTAVTPAADVADVAAMGLRHVLVDPRATLTEGLHAILIAELADNDGWKLLAEMADLLGQDELAADFRRALTEEQEHLRSVRAWLANMLKGQMGVAPTPPQPQPQP